MKIDYRMNDMCDGGDTNDEGRDEMYYLEAASLADDSVDGFNYDEIPDYNEPMLDGDLEEDYRTATQYAADRAAEMMPPRENIISAPTLRTRPEVIEDFVRNFMVRMNMSKTLDCFQTEWYEMKEKGILKEQDCNNVPDVYIRNRQLDELVNLLEKDVKAFRNAAEKAKEVHLKLRKERDFHRMHHKRVVQEKDRLIADIRRMKQHYASYEPTLKALQQKYETAMKEKMLTKLERDRAVGQIQGLQSMGQYVTGYGEETQYSEEKHDKLVQQQQEVKERKEKTKTNGPKTVENNPDDSKFPPDKGVNPLLSKSNKACPHLTRSSGFRMTKSMTAHALAVSSFALHPRKDLLATVSDDRTWKLWSIPDCEAVMTGEGHTDWISDVDFNPQGSQLVTSSGDTSVKIWDFKQQACVHTLSDHTHAVWGVSWHSCGDFIASCSMDGTTKIWDMGSLRCRNTLRGHTDSVNSVEFLPFSNTLVTCSADKTISLWDARTGLCAQTFYDHVHAINHVSFNMKGDVLASCDAYGVVKLWDVKSACVMGSVDMGPHPANRVAFDAASSVLAVASNDGTVKMLDIQTLDVTQLSGHSDAVQSVIFDRNGEYLMSGGSDGDVKIWS